MAMKRLPALSAPMVCFTRSKKYCLKMFGSSVVPDLLETMNRRLRQIDLVLECLDLRRIGGIEHVQFGEAGDLAESHAQHFRAQARSAHAEQQDVGEAFFLHVCDCGAQLVAVRDLLLGDAEPAQPLGFVGRRSRATHRAATGGEPCRRHASRRCWSLPRPPGPRAVCRSGRLTLALIWISSSFRPPRAVCRRPRRRGGLRRR